MSAKTSILTTPIVRTAVKADEDGYIAVAKDKLEPGVLLVKNFCIRRVYCVSFKRLRHRGRMVVIRHGCYGRGWYFVWQFDMMFGNDEWSSSFCDDGFVDQSDTDDDYY